MARERERQNVSSPVGDMSTQVKNMPTGNGADIEVNKPKQLKTDLDDDLQGIDIVFDAEEAEPDDRLPFPQTDDNLQQPAPMIVEQKSPQSIVEETESDVNEFSRPLAPNVDEKTRSEFLSRLSVSRPEQALTREPSVSSDKKFVEQSDDLIDSIPVKSSSTGFDFSNPPPLSSPQLAMPSKNYYRKNSPQHVSVSSGSRGHYQPPLPPVPPPAATFSPVMPQHQHADSFQGTSEFSSSPMPMLDSKYSRNSPGGSSRLPPPLPSTPPPPFSYNMPLLKTSISQSAYNQTGVEFAQNSNNVPMVDARLGAYPPPPLMPPMLFNRPPTNIYGNSQQGENTSMLQHVPFQSMHSQLQPLQPPQLPCPPQHPRPPLMHQPEQGIMPFQNPPIQMQMQVQMNSNYQSQQHHQVEPSAHLKPVMHQPAEVQQDPGMSLHEYFKSPEAIQSLLSDRDKLCQLLEQNPKLMQMLQERLGQL